VIDVRCTATCGSDSVPTRCQLYAGHVGSHTLLTLDDFGLVLRQWGRTGVHRDDTVPAHTPLPYPWAPGCPQVVTIAVEQKARGEAEVA